MRPGTTIPARIRDTWTNSSRRRIIVLSWRSSRGLSIALLAWATYNGVVPILMLLATGRLIGDVPAAARHGLSSADGHRLIDTFIVFAVLYAASLMSSSIQTGLSAITRTKFTYDVQERLVRSVSQPIGIEHLEDPEVRDRIELAQGSLMSYYVADAPVTLAQLFSLRISGALVCVVIGDYRWWMALALVAFWRIVLRQLNNRNKGAVRAFSGNAGIMRRAEYFNSLATKPDAAKENRVFGLGPWIVSELRRHWLDGMKESWPRQAGYYKEVPLLSSIGLVIYVGICAYLGHAAFIGAVSLTTVTTVLVLLPRAASIGSFSLVEGGIEWMVSGLPALAEIESAIEDRTREKTGTLGSAGRPHQSIVFENVTFSYPGSDRRIFAGLDLEIPAGQSTAIVGVNGVGKTTLVKLLARLHEPTSGHITVDGIDLADFEPREWQRRIAIVFQEFNHYPTSALENITFGASTDIGDIAGARASVDLAGASSTIDALPRGWETVLSREFANGTDLSGGQWQRVALARALFATRHGATTLILDEPTAWLDVQGEAAFYERFLEITHGLTTVVISHRFSTVRLADHICVLESGRLVERGSHGELIARRGIYAEMFESQASRFVDSGEPS